MCASNCPSEFIIFIPSLLISRARALTFLKSTYSQVMLTFWSNLDRVRNRTYSWLATSTSDSVLVRASKPIITRTRTIRIYREWKNVKQISYFDFARADRWLPLLLTSRALPVGMIPIVDFVRSSSLSRPGAPQLSLCDVRTEQRAGEYGMILSSRWYVCCVLNVLLVVTHKNTQFT